MAKCDYSNIWVHIERTGGRICSVSFELCSEAKRLCGASGEKVVAVDVGNPSEEELRELASCGADEMIAVSGQGYERYNTEAWVNLYTELCKKHRPSALFVGSTANGRDFAPRVAARLGTGCTSDATELVYNAESGGIEFIEPAAGGQMMAVITIPELRPQIGTLRPGAFRRERFDVQGLPRLRRETIDFDPSLIRTELLGYAADSYDPEFDIGAYPRLVCLGGGLKDESIPKYRELAHLLRAKLCCTRPLVDRGLFPPALQVGQSGVSVSPKLYLAFGVSGAVNHMTGVNAGRIIAVNRDPGAPIFRYCDYGLAADMDEACDALIAELKARGN